MTPGRGDRPIRTRRSTTSSSTGLHLVGAAPAPRPAGHPARTTVVRWLPTALAAVAVLGAVAVVTLVVASDESGRGAVALLAWAATGSVLAAVAATALAQVARSGRRISLATRRTKRVRHERMMLEQGRRQLVAWASDDLRTPLTGLRAMVEAVEAGAVRGPDELRRCHHRMLREIAHLGDLLDDLALLGGAAHAVTETEVPPNRSAGQELVFDLAYGDGMPAGRHPERGRSGATG